MLFTTSMREEGIVTDNYPLGSESSAPEPSRVFNTQNTTIINEYFTRKIFMNDAKFVKFPPLKQYMGSF